MAQAATIHQATIRLPQVRGQAAATVAAALAPATDIAAAEAFTRSLARSHYENFPVVSLLVPKHLRQDFCNVYAFCRTADDLGDEIPDRAEAARCLAQFKEQTRAAHAGTAPAAHPPAVLFAALAQTMRRHDMPVKPFLDLVDAFQQDQRVTRYQTLHQVLDYCRRSADPVGRIVLCMCGYQQPKLQQLSDHTCTALQLANFWQDVRRDILERDRIYIPLDSMKKFAVSEEQIAAGRCDENYRRLIRFEVDRTEALFARGDALLPLLAPAVRRPVGLFSKGGRAVLAAIRRQNYDTLSKRPSLSRWRKGRLVLGAMAAAALGRGRPGGAR